ncbi:acyl-CoA thioesterase [Pseudonocardia acaciae]|uniref:acyl-CoA thioesterase n=1 Tax=Pseudonocardia acaciae TaxID=551276 RepID=UPI00048D347F|nr:acyl-CoA thioesterase [Pseudonocardia acaciae]
MPDQFSVTVTVRSYEIDMVGHVNHAVYHQYGEHARGEHFRKAGFDFEAQRAGGMAVVLLESRIRYLSELVLGEEVEISSNIEFGTGKTFRIAHVLRRADGSPAAEIDCVLGLLDTTARRLMPEPRARFAALLAHPELLGIDGSGG